MCKVYWVGKRSTDLYISVAAATIRLLQFSGQGPPCFHISCCSSSISGKLTSTTSLHHDFTLLLKTGFYKDTYFSYPQKAVLPIYKSPCAAMGWLNNSLKQISAISATCSYPSQLQQCLLFFASFCPGFTSWKQQGQGGLNPVGVFRVLTSVTRFVHSVMEEREWVWLTPDMLNTDGCTPSSEKESRANHFQNQYQMYRCAQSGDRTHTLSPSFAH